MNVSNESQNIIHIYFCLEPLFKQFERAFSITHPRSNFITKLVTRLVYEKFKNIEVYCADQLAVCELFFLEFLKRTNEIELFAIFVESKFLKISKSDRYGCCER